MKADAAGTDNAWDVIENTSEQLAGAGLLLSSAGLLAEADRAWTIREALLSVERGRQTLRDQSAEPEIDKAASFKADSSVPASCMAEGYDIPEEEVW